ncbi:ATP-binding cassette domain-containing protein [Streptomyces sp. NPDC020490]|uniref:branched-chain amino acid ABC transporter ATP-binding protein/permease n=1 Tax=Streptomyces sp. NPDC020490 TaxID=3365078 RepID=UPI0037B19CE2
MLLIAAVSLALVTVSSEPDQQNLLTLILIWATVGYSWNILGGYGGQVSFGHSLFVGIGAYSTAILESRFGMPPLIGMAAGAAIAAGAAVVIGWPTFRLAGVYFSLATLAYPLMMRPVMNYFGFQEVTIPYHSDGGSWYLQFTDPRGLTYCALALMLVAIAISLAVERSKFGTALFALRDDEVAARAAGINVRRQKLAAYALSAAVAAVAGSVYTSVLLVVTPDSVFGLAVSVQALIIPLVGGRATIWGPLIGSVILVTLSDQLTSQFGADFPGLSGLLYGGALVAMVLFAPEGIYWRLHDLRRRARHRKHPVVAREDISADAGVQRARSARTAREKRRKPDEGEIILAVENLQKSFDGLEVLRDVSFSVRTGEILGIIGPNGAGKTTLFDIMNGFTRPDGGKIVLGDQDVTGSPPHVLCRKGIGRTFQVVRVFPRRSLLANVAVDAPGRPAGTLTSAEAIAAVGLQGREHLEISELDVGELRRMELARALATGPKVLLIDEIFAGLSHDEVEDLVELLRDARDMGVTIVIIEHTMKAMLKLADRLVVLNQGRVVADGEPGAVVRDRDVVAAYLGKRWANAAS